MRILVREMVYLMLGNLGLITKALFMQMELIMMVTHLILIMMGTPHFKKFMQEQIQMMLTHTLGLIQIMMVIMTTMLQLQTQAGQWMR